MRKPTQLLLAAAAALLLLLVLAVQFVLQPDRVAGFVLGALGDALGLEITATGGSEYRLRGGPVLVVRNVAVREPGAATPLLRAQRVYVAVPWSTVRSRGARLDITRIELDAPVLDVPALQRWLASRPPGGAQRMPTLSEGLEVQGGRVLGEGWRIDGLRLSLPRLLPGRPVGASLAGRLAAGELSARFDLAAAMTEPANDAGTAIAGTVTAASGAWRLPARLRASAQLHFGDDGIRSRRLRARLAARYESGATRLPFAFALDGPLLLRGGTAALAPAGFALRGGGLVPELEAGGALAYGKRLLVDLDGRLADWPEAWPALPPPLGASDAPLPFVLDYLGQADLSDPAHLRLQRDDTRADVHLRAPEVLTWVESFDTGSPLPPLRGRVSTPRIEVAGAQLEGVEIEFDDPTLPGPAP